MTTNPDGSIALERAVRSHSLFLVISCALAAASAGCGGTIVDLGDPRPPPYRFGTPRLLSELDTTYSNQNPTLTGDLLDIYFTSNRSDMSTGSGANASARSSYQLSASQAAAYTVATVLAGWTPSYSQ